MDRARVQTMHVILVCTQTLAQLTLNRTEACIALMEGMIDVTSNGHERLQIVVLTQEDGLPRDLARPRTRIFTPIDHLHVGKITWLQ